MPRFMASVALLPVAVLFSPESIWNALGVDSLRTSVFKPRFVSYYVECSDFPNAMFVFWLVGSIVLLINSYLAIVHLNGAGYSAFLMRRGARIKTKKHSSAWLVLISMIAFVVAYFLATAIYLREPSILGGHAPATSRLVMALLHGGSLGLVLPIFISSIVTELRARLTQTTSRGT